MVKSRVILLIAVTLALFSLFVLSSWTNALVVQEEEIPTSLSIISTVSPLLLGILIVAALALLILISVD